MSSEREIIVELSFSRYTIVPNDNGEDAEREFAGTTRTICLDSILLSHSLQELALFKCTLECDSDALQFYSLRNLKSLKIINCGLRRLHFSIGLLTRLRYLNVSSNALCAFPDSLKGCEYLEDLIFSRGIPLPGGVLSLQHLKTVRRFDQQHMGAILELGGGYICLDNDVIQSNSVNTEPSTLLPSLQQLAFQNMKYAAWTACPINIAQRLHGTSGVVHICDGCDKLILSCSSYTSTTVTMFKFLELRSVHFVFHTCSNSCTLKVRQMILSLQEQAREEICNDECYEEQVEQANAEFGLDQYYRKRMKQLRSRNRRSQKCCSIM